MKYIELENITFSYSEEEPPVLKDFSVSVEKGKCLIVEGDNGSGKTTLFRLLNGLSFPQEGHYRFDGQEITGRISKELDRQITQKIQMIFQDPMASLNERAKIDYIVSEGLQGRGLSKAEISEKIPSQINKLPRKPGRKQPIRNPASPNQN